MFLNHAQIVFQLTGFPELFVFNKTSAKIFEGHARRYRENKIRGLLLLYYLI